MRGSPIGLWGLIASAMQSLGKKAGAVWKGLAAVFAAILLSPFPAAMAQSVAPPIGLDEDDVPIAMLVDTGTGQVLFSRNPDRRFVPASITKAMTLYTAFDLVEEGKLGLQQSLTVRPETWLEWRYKGSRMFLNADEDVPVGTLLTGIANVSANDAAIVLAEGAMGSVTAWTAQMNIKARAIGMTQSHFGTPNGWPDEGRTFTTARDLVTLGGALTRDHPRAVARFIGLPGFRYGGIAQTNQDPMLGRVKGADGIKTGYTNEAGFGFLGTAKRGDQRLVMVVAGVARKGVRNRAARNLMEWGFSAFDRRSLFDAGAVITRAQVQDGSQRSVRLISEVPVTLSIPKGQDKDIRITVRYDGPLRAPINTGDVVANLELETPGLDTLRIPLVADESVAKAGFFARIANAFAGWFA